MARLTADCGIADEPPLTGKPPKPENLGVQELLNLTINRRREELGLSPKWRQWLSVLKSGTPTQSNHHR